VTLRVASDAPNLGREYLMKVIRAAIRESHKARFRVVEFNVLSNHAHFITEADDRESLSRGMQGLEVRIARRLNSALKRTGKLFPVRFHARYLKTPREVRNCLRYVLLNRKHHAAEKKFSKYWVDPCSSGAWFDGWREPIRVTADWMQAIVDMPRPTVSATTWLLRVRWQKHGLIGFDERPA
jgi:REP element-mobilizing transposase RayT